MKNSYLFLSAFLLGSTITKAQVLTAAEILEKSIEYHDPDGMWSSFNAKFNFRETRPNGPDRISSAEIDNNRGWFKMNRNDEEIHGMLLDSCFLISGKADCSRAEVMRNYYLYLWGLPMKLKDEGTQLDREYTVESYEGKECYKLRVPYAEDIWYFYVTQDEFEMIAYSFYKDEEKGKGELITLDGVYQFNNMKIPNNRTWYELPGKRVLGTDILESAEKLN